MSVVIINPNSTDAMTRAMVATSQTVVPELAFEGWTSLKGPPSIQGRADGAAATPPFLELVQQASDQGAAGIIIGCFDDTALHQAAALAACPVIGIGQAAYAQAALRQWRFSVVTTLSVSVPIIEENIDHQGMTPFLSKVRASEVPVLTLEAEPERAEQDVVSQARLALAEDGIDAVILGCAGMVNVVEAVQAALPVPVIDPVTCAASCMRWLVAPNQ